MRWSLPIAMMAHKAAPRREGLAVNRTTSMTGRPSGIGRRLGTCALALTCAFGFAVPTAAGASPASAPLVTSDEIGDLVDIARQAITGRNEVLLVVPNAARLRIVGNGHAIPSESFLVAEEIVRAELASRRQVLSEVGEEYAWALTDFRFLGHEQDGNLVIISAEEYTKLGFTPTDDAAAPTFTEFVIPRSFQYHWSGSSWALTGYSLSETDGPVPMNEPAGSTEMEMRQALAPVRAFRQQADSGEASIVPLADDPGGGSGKSGPYSYNAMINYADRYWDNYNPNYRNFAGDQEGGDCTNFISQAMYAGGWEQVTGWYRDDNNWWYNAVNQTWTWINVQYWYTFAKVRTGRTTLRSNAMNMVPSDVLQADWFDDGSKNHTMIVTAKRDGVPLLTYHSTDHHNRSLANLMAANEDARWIPHKT
jgi:hypothetical protein